MLLNYVLTIFDYKWSEAKAIKSKSVTSFLYESFAEMDVSKYK